MNTASSQQNHGNTPNLPPAGSLIEKPPGPPVAGVLAKARSPGSRMPGSRVPGSQMPGGVG